MKPTPQQIIDATGRLSALSMFPSNPAAHTEIMRLLDRMVATEEHLQWLVDTMIDRVGEWKGPAQLRGLLCTRYAPFDGIEAQCTISGFSPIDSESQTLIEHEDRKRQELADSAIRIAKLLM